MIFSAERVAKMEYFLKEVPKIDWQWMFVVGILFGSLISSVTAKTFKIEAIPPMCATRFCSNRSQRSLTALIGGTIAMFGARLADG